MRQQMLSRTRAASGTGEGGPTRKKSFLRRAGRFIAPIAAGTAVGYGGFKAAQPLINKMGYGAGASIGRQRIGEIGSWIASDVAGTGAGVGVEKLLSRKRKRKSTGG